MICGEVIALVMASPIFLCLYDMLELVSKSICINFAWFGSVRDKLLNYLNILKNKGFLRLALTNFWTDVILDRRFQTLFGRTNNIVIIDEWG